MNHIFIMVIVELLLLFLYDKHMKKAGKFGNIDYLFGMIVGLIVVIMTSIFMLMVELMMKDYLNVLLSLLLIYGCLKKLYSHVKN